MTIYRFPHHLSTVAKMLCLTVAMVWSALSAAAFDTSCYADTSRLADGRWVKVAVEQSGIYRITAADLKRYGFSDPSKVCVFGYGGARLADRLAPDTYTDDLPQVASVNTAAGLVFYARGPETWTQNTVYPGRFTHSLNPYSTAGYYYLTDRADFTPYAPPADGIAELRESAATQFRMPLFHENELTSPGESGHLLVGEDFLYNRTQTFQFPLTDFDADPASDCEVWVQCRFVTDASAAGEITVTVNGQSQRVPSAATSSTAYGTLTTFRGSFTLAEAAAKASVTISYSCPGTVRGAWLDAIDLNYPRKLAMPASGALLFTTTSAPVTLRGASADTHVWDVTDPLSISAMNTTAESQGAVAWVNAHAGYRQYAAWNEKTTLPSPRFVEVVANQNLHGEPVPQMVIFTPAEWRSQAERIADLHRRTDSLSVRVVDVAHVYNEFSSGSPDVNALRRYLKMNYDRDPATLRYAMLFGRAIHDNRGLTAPVRALREISIPCWQTDESLREIYSYMADDFLAALADGSGMNLAADTLCIAVGRVPAGTVAEARAFADKMEAYLKAGASSRNNAWKSRVMLVADDGDRGVHLQQAESQYAEMMSLPLGRNLTYSKIYVDAYDEVGGVSEVGRARMHELLGNGVMWWTYIGHGDRRALSSEKLLSFTDVPQMSTRNFAFFYGATCSFMRWDGVEKSSCELMLHNPSGGVIAAVCPTREAYISDNGYMSTAVGRHAFVRNSDGSTLAAGEIFRRAKNDLRTDAGDPVAENSNKLRFCFMGDPALKLILPEASAALETVNGRDVLPVDDADEPTVIMARQNVTVTGSVRNGLGDAILDDFNGKVTVTLYDAEETVTTQGRPSDNTEGEVKNFEQQGGMLYTACDSVVNGRFTLRIAMPSEVADNFRPAAMAFHAVSHDGLTEAVGCNRDFYVYGFDDTAEADTVPPVIHYAVLNHSSFVSGDVVNPSPMFLAQVSDNVGLNLSSAGIGRRMTVKIDGRETLGDVSDSFVPDAGGEAAGMIAYQLPSLSEGSHTLQFRVWDTSGNSATSQIDFAVSEAARPTLYEVYTDANPASVEANFYLSHNRPDAMLTVTFEVFNLMGRLEWSTTVTDRADLFTSAPVRWNLCDNSGRRVPRGIYLYRASVTCDGATSSTIARRIAVASAN